LEKRLGSLKRIVVTGPESTGKTNIAGYLANKFNCDWIPEFARYYIENIQSDYDYSDIETIARKQVEDYHTYSGGNRKILIFDTWLIVTKVWFQVIYKKYPPWIQNSIENLKIDLYLLCVPDIEWHPDPVRENGGKMRHRLFKAYENEIKHSGVPYGLVKGTGEERYQMAEDLVKAGFFLSFGEAIGGNSDKVKESLRMVPSDKLFLETDEGELDIREIYHLTSGIKRISLDDLRSQIFENTRTTFSRFAANNIID